jgi:AraC family of transcriptional regulator, multidrug resistance transcriptional activator
LSIKTIENMVDWVEINLIDDPSLEKMSDYVGYSSYYCSSKFHEAVGVSFKEYVMKRRLTLASVDLRETDCRIIDIAVKYGFSSNEAFTRAFYKNFGYTPSQFRKLLPQLSMYGKSEILSSNS